MNTDLVQGLAAQSKPSVAVRTIEVLKLVSSVARPQ